MCALCAAIPMAASMGVAATAKQKEQRHLYEARGENPPLMLPAGKTTVVVVTSLVAASAVYHTILMPRLGA
jgi:hypothetical protein